MSRGSCGTIANWLEYSRNVRPSTCMLIWHKHARLVTMIERKANLGLFMCVICILYLVKSYNCIEGNGTLHDTKESSRVKRDHFLFVAVETPWRYSASSGIVSLFKLYITSSIFFCVHSFVQSFIHSDRPSGVSVPPTNFSSIFGASVTHTYLIHWAVLLIIGIQDENLVK